MLLAVSTMLADSSAEAVYNRMDFPSAMLMKALCISEIAADVSFYSYVFTGCDW